MCGRYYGLLDKQQVAEHFHVRTLRTMLASSHRITTLGLAIPNPSSVGAVTLKSANS
jgi:hypothetical protein